MKTAERMRRDGWKDGWYGWRKAVCGVVCEIQHRTGLAKVDEEDGFGWIFVNDGNLRLGLRDLAQRAKASARKLARRKR